MPDSPLAKIESDVRGFVRAVDMCWRRVARSKSGAWSEGYLVAGFWLAHRPLLAQHRERWCARGHGGR